MHAYGHYPYTPHRVGLLLISFRYGIRSDAVLVNIFLSDLLSVKALLFHYDRLLIKFLAVFELLDNIGDVRGLEWVTLTVIVPVLVEQLFK